MEFSIVIPTQNRRRQLAECVRAAARVCSSDFEWELVIVDDGSEPRVEPPSDDGASWHEVRVVREKGSGPSTARNSGARQARGRVLVFVDDDCVPDAEILVELRKSFLDNPDALVGGRVEHGCTDNFWSTVTHATTSAAYEIQEVRDRRPRRFSTSVLAVPREAFLDVGGFDESFALPGGEDYEFCERWGHSGRPARYVPSAGVVHFHPLTFAQFVRQQFRYGRGLSRTHQLAKGQDQGRSLGAKLRDTLRLVAHPLKRNKGIRSLELAAGILVAQTVTAVGATWEWKGPRVKSTGISGE